MGRKAQAHGKSEARGERLSWRTGEQTRARGTGLPAGI